MCSERSCRRKAGGGLISLMGGEKVGWMQGVQEEGRYSILDSIRWGVKRGGQRQRFDIPKTKTTATGSFGYFHHHLCTTSSTATI